MHIIISYLFFKNLVACGLLPIKFDSHDHSKIYWPWHVILYKDQSHICDATLVSLNWILTTISCFQVILIILAKIPFFTNLNL